MHVISHVAATSDVGVLDEHRTRPINRARVARGRAVGEIVAVVLARREGRTARLARQLRHKAARASVLTAQACVVPVEGMLAIGVRLTHLASSALFTRSISTASHSRSTRASVPAWLAWPWYSSIAWAMTSMAAAGNKMPAASFLAPSTVSTQ